MHIQMCALRCHFNWLKSFNWQQRGEDGGSLRRRSGLAWKSRQSVCHAKHVSGFVYQACSGVSALWQLMWQLHSGFQLSGHVVLEGKQEDGTQLIWLPMMYITHPRPTSRRDSQARRRGCWISVNKAWLTWRQTICEAQLKIRATERKGIGGKAGTQQDCVGQLGSHTTPDERPHVQLCGTFPTADSTLVF